MPPKARVRTTIKYEYSTERQQLEIVERTFDKLESKYHEVYSDLDGGIVFEKHPDLNDQSESAHGKRGRLSGAAQEHPVEAVARILPYLPPHHPALAGITDPESPPPSGRS